MLLIQNYHSHLGIAIIFSKNPEYPAKYLECSTTFTLHLFLLKLFKKNAIRMNKWLELKLLDGKDTHFFPLKASPVRGAFLPEALFPGL